MKEEKWWGFGREKEREGQVNVDVKPFVFVQHFTNFYQELFGEQKIFLNLTKF